MNGKEMTGRKVTGRLDAWRKEGWTVERRRGRLDGRRIIWKAEAKVGRKEDNMEGEGEGCTEGRQERCRAPSFLLSQWTEEQPEKKRIFVK
jgi:hypothetical protein